MEGARHRDPGQDRPRQGSAPKTSYFDDGILEAEFGRKCATFINGDGEVRFQRRGSSEPEVRRVDREEAARQFNEGEVRYLVSTEAAGEGIDLQERCATLIHVDLPWNPMRLHQRVGRLSRYGQRRPVTVVTLRNPDTVEARIWDKLDEKLARVMQALAGVMEEPEDLRQLVLGMTSPTLFTELFADAPARGERLTDWFDRMSSTLGGEDVVDAVRKLVGNVQRFDFGSIGRDLPKVDLPDLESFFRNVVRLAGRRLQKGDEGLELVTPDAWHQRDFAIMDRYAGLTFDRQVRGRGAADRVLGVGHRLFEASLQEALKVEPSPAVIKGLKEPIAAFLVRDRVTSGERLLTPMVVGARVSLAGERVEFLRDWELLLELNRFGSPRQSADTAPTINGSARLSAKLDTLLPEVSAFAAKLTELRVPEVEIVAIFLPASRGSEDQAADESG
jgi:hypothetical protein